MLPVDSIIWISLSNINQIHSGPTINKSGIIHFLGTSNQPLFGFGSHLHTKAWIRLHTKIKTKNVYCCGGDAKLGSSLDSLLNKRVPRHIVFPNPRCTISGQKAFKISYDSGQPYFQISLDFLEIIPDGVQRPSCGKLSLTPKIIPMVTLSNLSL